MIVEFVDTNVLVYAHDPTTRGKNRAARLLLERLWEEGSGAVSVQVLQELVWTVTRKVPRPLGMEAALALAEDYLAWTVFAPRGEDVLAAGRLAERTSISFWDAMIVQAASSVGASVLWSEDLNPGQTIAGVKVRSPFDGTPALA